MSRQHAVLLLHGFTSHISCVEAPAEALRESGFRVETPVLPGHGGVWRDMTGVTHRDWFASAEKTLLELFSSTGSKVLVGGFSMGGLVAIELAVTHPEKVCGLVLAAPALRFIDPLAPYAKLLCRIIPFWPGPSSFNDRRLNRSRNRNYRFFPLSSFASLYEYADMMRGRLSELTVPLCCLHSFADRVISVESVREIVREARSAKKRVTYLHRSGHELFLDSEQASATAIVAGFFQELELACS